MHLASSGRVWWSCKDFVSAIFTIRKRNIWCAAGLSSGWYKGLERDAVIRKAKVFCDARARFFPSEGKPRGGAGTTAGSRGLSRGGCRGGARAERNHRPQCRFNRVRSRVGAQRSLAGSRVDPKGGWVGGNHPGWIQGV